MFVTEKYTEAFSTRSKIIRGLFQCCHIQKKKNVMSLTLGEKLLSFGYLLPTIKEIAYQMHGFITIFIKSNC